MGRHQVEQVDASEAEAGRDRASFNETMKLDLHECAAAADTHSGGFKRKQKETCDEAKLQQTTDSSEPEKKPKSQNFKDASRYFGKM